MPANIDPKKVIQETAKAMGIDPQNIPESDVAGFIVDEKGAAVGLLLNTSEARLSSFYLLKPEHKTVIVDAPVVGDSDISRTNGGGERHVFLTYTEGDHKSQPVKNLRYFQRKHDGTYEQTEAIMASTAESDGPAFDIKVPKDKTYTRNMVQVDAHYDGNYMYASEDKPLVRLPDKSMISMQDLLKSTRNPDKAQNVTYDEVVALQNAEYALGNSGGKLTPQERAFLKDFGQFLQQQDNNLQSDSTIYADLMKRAQSLGISTKEQGWER